jgi:hypothetical protein
MPQQQFEGRVQLVRCGGKVLCENSWKDDNDDNSHCEVQTEVAILNAMEMEAEEVNGLQAYGGHQYVQQRLSCNTVLLPECSPATID